MSHTPKDPEDSSMRDILYWWSELWPPHGEFNKVQATAVDFWPGAGDKIMPCFIFTLSGQAGRYINVASDVYDLLRIIRLVNTGRRLN